MEDSAVPRNLSVPKVTEGNATTSSACANTVPKLGEHVRLFNGKKERKKASSWKNAHL